MIEKRNWHNLGLLLIGCLICLALWNKTSNPSISPDIPIFSRSITVYKLYTQNTSGHHNQFLYLPEKDYTQLIDLDFNFTLVNFGCNETNNALLLLVLVHSSPKNVAKRRTIRETWGKKDDNVKLLFLVGSVNSTEIQNILEDENSLHNDIIQGSFLDTYRNITYKHVMAFKYAIYHCPQAKYILKTDDDVFVNMPTMIKFLTFDLSPYGASNVLFCTPRFNSKVLRSYRSKWRVSFSEYPYRVYPTYCPGWALLYSPDVIYALYKEAQKTDYFWIDDIHITGTLTEKLSILHTDIEYLVLSEKNLGSIVENSQNVSVPFLYGRANMRDKEIRALWNFSMLHDSPKFIFRDVERKYI
ncbi:unnamed protein product [Phaedon cochleariae]|uniref:Hexosyltransferase n=1 Tax=Phaedon cochleariae TaxID=80249 RepID=A0A9N9X547_PHACE|nr:unnamed protein product [Phaedon cochleariae]